MLWPLMKSAISAPLMPKGSASRTVKGWLKALNCAASTMYATMRPITNAKPREAKLSWKAWLVPEGTAR